MLALRASALFLVAALLVGCQTKLSKPSADDVTVHDLIAAVRKACNDAKADLAANPSLNKLPLSSVTVTVQTKLTESVGVGFDLVVVSAKGQFDTSATQSLAIKLLPTPPAIKALVTEQEVYKEVLDAIKAAAAAATAAHSAAGTDFALSTITVSIGFDATRTASGGLKLVVGTVTIGPSASAGITGSQKIDLVFGSAK